MNKLGVDPGANWIQNNKKTEMREAVASEGKRVLFTLIKNERLQFDHRGASSEAVIQKWEAYQ